MDNNENRKAFDFDEEWDVEKILQQRYEREQLPQEPERVMPKEPVQPVYEPASERRSPAQRQSAARQNRKKKKSRVNWRGWAIVIGAGLLILAMLIGVIALIVYAVGGSDEPEPQTADATEVTEVT